VAEALLILPHLEGDVALAHGLAAAGAERREHRATHEHHPAKIRHPHRTASVVVPRESRLVWKASQ